MKVSAYKSGFIDAILGRDCKCSYHWTQGKSLHAYMKGYIEGQQLRKTHGITLTVERMDDDK